MQQPFWIQSTIQSKQLLLVPLSETDFEEIYLLAADPLVWEQHPASNRYELAVFKEYFESALQSGGAYKIIEKQTGAPVGCTRFYDYTPEHASIFIGYTFLARTHWKRGYNQEVKQAMVDHAFLHVDCIYFHVGVSNIRSQQSLEKFGAVKLHEQEISHNNAAPVRNFLYQIKNQLSNTTVSNCLLSTIKGYNPLIV